MDKKKALNKEEKDVEITIIYDYNKSKEIKIDDKIKEIIKQGLGETISREKLLGEIFVKKNKTNCKMIINGKEKEICSYLPNYHEYLDKGKLILKLIVNKNITDISYMFSGCLSLISLPNISKINSNYITNIRGMFFYCSSLIYIDDISRWETKNINDLIGIFQKCTNLISIPDISKWNTNYITDIGNIFNGCSSLTSLPDISNWNTENMINMWGIFDGCSSLTSLPDISKWNKKM